MSYTETMMEYVYDQYCIDYNMENTLDFLEDEINFTREEIKEMIQYTIDYNKNQFIKDYNSLVEQFKTKLNFSKIDRIEEKIKWPKKSGVYVVWKDNDNSFKNLIYVGMTGKFKRDKKTRRVIFNKGAFNKREYRYTPYRFCESKKDGEKQFSFRYIPKGKNSKEQSKIKYEKEAYEKTIRYSRLIIHCFHVSESHKDYTPELLEKEILTKYLKSSGELPDANNEL